MQNKTYIEKKQQRSGEKKSEIEQRGYFNIETRKVKTNAYQAPSKSYSLQAWSTAMTHATHQREDLSMSRLKQGHWGIYRGSCGIDRH